jgi:dTMP kinase
VIDFAVGPTRPDLTLLLHIPIEVSESRRLTRQSPSHDSPERDRMEEADRAFFERVEEGFMAIAASEPQRVRMIDATHGVEAVSWGVWEAVGPLVAGE